MKTCSHCAIEIENKGIETEEGIYCCERCYQRAMELRKTQKEREETYISAINVIVAALDLREHETGMHSQRVSDYTHFLAEKAGLPDEECLAIRRGALLHDIGKIGIPDSILLKHGTLTPEEWEIMRHHPEMAYRLFADINFLQTSAAIVYAHHEHYDGSGYPMGLKGKDIPLGARLFAISETVDALISARPYHSKKTFADACEAVRSQAGRDFDPELVSLFLAYSEEFKNKFKLE